MFTWWRRCNVQSPAAKDRLIGLGLLVLLTVPIAICTVPTAHTRLEAILNLLWILLAAGGFGHWLVQGGSRDRVNLELASVVFVLALLFPVMSTSDDYAEQEFINDGKTSQSLISSLKSEKKQYTASTTLSASPAVTTAQFLSIAPRTFEFVSETAIPGNRAAVIHATGNHSPPIC
jgi:hypothetical protein